MRLLFVQRTPWAREYGAARVLVDLAEELERLGHSVDHYCEEDALPRIARNRFAELVRPRFSRFAGRHIQAVASRYDVIDAREGDLPFSKRALGFDGLLAARAQGLSHAYQEFSEFSEQRWPDQPRGTAIGEAIRSWRAGRVWPDFELSWRHADLVMLLNPDEVPYLAAAGVGDKAVVLPLGLSAERLAALRAGSASPAERLRRREVVFIGYWYPRKGSLDLGEIVRRVRERVPDVRFTLLGTLRPRGQVLRDLGLGTPDWIRIVPNYANEDLPALLAKATVGVAPSYAEGFPLGVFEQLAAGVPCVAYDAAGSRELLRGFEPQGLMAPRGDQGTLADRLVAILLQDVHSYAAVAGRCQAVAASFPLRRLAMRTAEIYETTLTRIRQAA